MMLSETDYLILDNQLVKPSQTFKYFFQSEILNCNIIANGSYSYQMPSALKVKELLNILLSLIKQSYYAEKWQMS